MIRWAIAAPIVLCASAAIAQVDPGVRGGAAGAGGFVSGLSASQLNFLAGAKEAFEEVDDVALGLGPRFNSDSCVSCHSQPDVGGTSPAVNPQIAVANKAGAINTVPSFVVPGGPAREARFKSDGGVHDLFTIAGRVDAPGCVLAQPNFAQQLKDGNLSFRIPTPTFGAGFVESTPDVNLINDAAAMAGKRNGLGVGGKFTHKQPLGAVNNNGNTGTIARFGWKAQNVSMLMFAGEAYNVEIGVTNELFPQERQSAPGCEFTTQPEDAINMTTGGSSDISLFSIFMSMLEAPQPAQDTSSSARGRAVFNSIGCDACHIPQHTTGPSAIPGLNQVTYTPYSDFQVHQMGKGLADDIPQGEAAGDEFRTAPLWGVGQRIFFLHDGRTADLLQAIQAHDSPKSEASGVISKFNQLSVPDKQAILDFLRKL